MDLSQHTARTIKGEALRDASSRTSREVARLIEHLHERDVSCPLCGYNLRNLKQTRCPECRHQLSLTVGVRDVPLMAFIAAIVPGAFSGITAVFMLVPIFFSQRTAGGGNVPWFIVVIEVFGFLSGFFTTGLIIRRRSFLAWKLATQRQCALLIWLVHVGALAFLLGMVFHLF